MQIATIEYPDEVRIVVPQAVIDELDVGRRQGYDVPDCSAYRAIYLA